VVIPTDSGQDLGRAGQERELDGTIDAKSADLQPQVDIIGVGPKLPMFAIAMGFPMGAPLLGRIRALLFVGPAASGISRQGTDVFPSPAKPADVLRAAGSLVVEPRVAGPQQCEEFSFHHLGRGQTGARV
jgi:hypothetical protein